MQGNGHMVMKEPKQETGQLTNIPAVATTPRLEEQREGAGPGHPAQCGMLWACLVGARATEEKQFLAET